METTFFGSILLGLPLGVIVLRGTVGSSTRLYRFGNSLITLFLPVSLIKNLKKKHDTLKSESNNV